jgi:hypothetical protein
MKCTLLGLLMLCLWGNLGHAQELQDPFEGMNNPKRMLRGAAFTEAQVVQIRDLRRATRQREVALEREIDALGSVFWDKYLADAPLDAKAFVALEERINQLNREMDLLKIQSMIKIRALLTKEQLTRVAQSRGKIKELDRAIQGMEKAVNTIEAQRKQLDAQKKTIAPTVAGESIP